MSATPEELISNLAKRKAHYDFERVLEPYAKSYGETKDRAHAELTKVLTSLVDESGTIPLDKYDEAIAAWKQYESTMREPRERWFKAKDIAEKQLKAALATAQTFLTRGE